MTSATDQPSLSKCPVLWFSPHWQVVLAEIITAVQTLSPVLVCLFSGTKKFDLCLSSSQQYELKLGPQGAEAATAVPLHTHQSGQDEYQSEKLQPFWAHQAIPCGSRLRAGELPLTRNSSQGCPLRLRSPLPATWYLLRSKWQFALGLNVDYIATGIFIQPEINLSIRSGGNNSLTAVQIIVCQHLVTA